MHNEPHVPLDGLQRFLILLCVSVPSFMLNLDSNIVAVSLSSIAHSLHADFADIEWVISAYTLAFASFVMPAGALSDRFGRKRILLIGLSLFTLASFICGAAPNVTALNAARALQGLGAALLLSAALATLSHSFRGPQRASAFAFWGSVIGIAISLGPVVGGFITQHFGWEWAFYINVPIGVAIIALVLRTLKESRDPHATGIDIPGVVTFSGSLFLITLALISGNRQGWDNVLVQLELVGAVVLFTLFLWVESRQQRPMMDLSIFRNPTYVGACIAGLAYAASLLTMLSYLPIFFQSALGYSPQNAGLLMLPLAAPLFVVPRITASYLTHRYSGRALLTLGLLIISVGMFWLGVEAPGFEYSAMLGGLLLAGIGAGVLNGETAKVAMSAIAPERAGMASGISGTVRFSGIVVGFAALGAILFHRVAASVATGLSGSALIDPIALTRSIAAGDLSAGPLALSSFGAGYQAILFVASGVALISALLAWLLVRTADTAPTVHHTATPQGVASAE